MRRWPMRYNILVILIPLLSQLGSTGVSNAFPLARTDSVTRSDISLVFTRADTEVSDRPTEDEIPSTNTVNDSKEEKAADNDKNGNVNDANAQDGNKNNSTSGTEEVVANGGEENDKGKEPDVVTNNGSDKSGKENASNEVVQDSNKVTSGAEDDTTNTAKDDEEVINKGKGPDVANNKVTSGAEEGVNGDTSATTDAGQKSDNVKGAGVAGNKDANGESSGSKTDDQATSSDNIHNEPVQDKVEQVKEGTDDTSDKPVSNTEETKDSTDTSNAGKEETGGNSNDNDTGKDEGEAKHAAKFMEVRSFEFDESTRTGTINGDIPVRLLSGGAELGKPDSQKISRKYFVATMEDRRAVGILKVVNLVKASNEQGPETAHTLTQEGALWKKIGDKRFMWHKTIKSPTSGRKKEYRVLYRAMYDQVDVDNQPLTLRFLHEWAQMKDLDDKREWDPKILPECRKTAVNEHVRLANRDIGITKFSLWSWVTDESCKHWFPYEAPPAYSFNNQIGLMMTREVTVKGVKLLEKKDQKKKHLELLKTPEFTKYFTLPEVQRAKDDLQKIKQSRGDKSDRGYYPWAVTAQ